MNTLRVFAQSCFPSIFQSEQQIYIYGFLKSYLYGNNAKLLFGVYEI